MPADATPLVSEALLRKKIEERAYALWESEGRPSGRDVDHWHRARCEIAARCATGSEGTTSGGTASTRKPNKRPANHRSTK